MPAERLTMRLTFDIETDGLDATKIWCLVIQNLDTNRIMKYTDESDKYDGPIKMGLSLKKSFPDWQIFAPSKFSDNKNIINQILKYQKEFVSIF